jgi:hypothetical protein
VEDSRPRRRRSFSAEDADDADIIPLLHRLAQPTFFTHDVDFFERGLCHRNYALIWLDLSPIDAARYIRAFLRHPEFDTNAKRLGKVIRVHPDGLTLFDSPNGKPKHAAWLRSVC